MAAEETSFPISDEMIGNKELMLGPTMTESVAEIENTTDTGTLEYLVRRLLATKKTEEDIKAMRIICEEKIAALVPGPERGQKTVKLPDGTKITVERGFNYKTNVLEIENFCSENGLALPVKVKTTRELDVVGYEWYHDNDPSNFLLIAKHVTATPKKVAVTIKCSK